MIRRLTLVFVVVFFAVAASISSPSSVNAAGFLERFQGTQQSNQKVQEEQYPKQAKYPSQDQYSQDKQLPQTQQTDQGKDGNSYFKDQLNQLDTKSGRQTTPGQSKPGAASD